MAMGSFGRHGHNAPNAEINTTPLVDVMLVLLVIFILTAPLFTHTVKLDLPQASAQPDPEPPPAVTLSLDGEGHLYWDNRALSDDELAAKFAETAAREPVPELQLRADRETRYQRLAEIMAAAQQAGLKRIGFITEPPRAL